MLQLFTPTCKLQVLTCILSVAFSCLEEKEKPRFGALQYKLTLL